MVNGCYTTLLYWTCTFTRDQLFQQKDDGTQQTKRRGGGRWIGFQNKTKFLKLEIQKLILYGSYHKTFINQTQSIPNQSTLYTRSFIKILSFTKIYSWTFTKMIKTKMRDKDQIKRSTQLFYIASLSITREANPAI